LSVEGSESRQLKGKYPSRLVSTQSGVNRYANRIIPLRDSAIHLRGNDWTSRYRSRRKGPGGAVCYAYAAESCDLYDGLCREGNDVLSIFVHNVTHASLGCCICLTDLCTPSAFI
jgi:hypothetical protein